MNNIAVSACLLGHNCKYNGGNNRNEKVLKLARKYNLIPICPETFGGLNSPRNPAEIVGDKVLLKSGEDVTAEFLKGAEIALKTAIENNCKLAILKERSPSCGINLIYSGEFNGTVVEGSGITARLLAENSIKTLSENEVDKL